MTLWESVKRVLLTWTINSFNLLVFILSYGTVTLHEGRFYKWFGVWSNWNSYFKYKPQTFAQPTSEQEICELVKSAKGKVRVVAGGHSFNTGTDSEGGLVINLDKYSDHKFVTLNGVTYIRVQAGLRLRDFITITEKEGFDIPVMGTTNAQSIGGLVASDLHATGRESGYLSQQVVELRIVNSNGQVETFKEDSNVFKFALGGIGAMGVVIEATIRLVPGFNCRRVTQYVDRALAEREVGKLLSRHEHVGLFYIGGLHAKKLRLTTYDHVLPYETKTRFVYFKNFIAQIFDLINGGFLLDFARFLPQVLPVGYFFWNTSFLGENFVDTAGKIFTSRLFFRHDEMEYAMPLENFPKIINELMDFLDEHKIIALMEVRFTLGTAQTKSLIGPGAGRDSCFIEILPTLTHDTRAIYALTEHIFEKYGGRPHLGKFTTYQTPDMRKHYGDSVINDFQKSRQAQDPDRKFVNEFVKQVFLTETPSDPTVQHY